MASRRPEEIVGDFIDLVNRQDLIGRAAKAVMSYRRDADSDDMDWAFTLEELRPELGAQMLCLRSGTASVRAPYIATNLQLYALGYQVGWYELLTTLGGESIREDGSILDDYRAGGRAAALIARARERAVGDPREWIGVVGLRARPGSTFFPDWALGGFTTALALAANEKEYRQRVEGFFVDKGVDVEDVEDLEPLAERLRANPSIDDETLELAVALSDSLPVVHTSTIHSYSAEEGDGAEGRASDD